MKFCFIQNDFLPQDKIIGLLTYYSSDRSFCIDLDKRRKPIDMALLLGAYAEKGQFTLDPAWSERWVSQRIVPTDRQNLGMILREAGLKEYDRYKLLLLSGGHCAQDDLSICPVREDRLEGWMRERLKKRLTLAVPLTGFRMLLLRGNKEIHVVKLRPLLSKEDRFRRICADEAAFSRGRLITGGSGLTWGEGLYLMAEDILARSKPLPINEEDLRQIISASVMDTAQICAECGVSRQYVNKLTADGQLKPLPLSGRSRLYLRSDVPLAAKS